MAADACKRRDRHCRELMRLAVSLMLFAAGCSAVPSENGSSTSVVPRSAVEGGAGGAVSAVPAPAGLGSGGVEGFREAGWGAWSVLGRAADAAKRFEGPDERLGRAASESGFPRTVGGDDRAGPLLTLAAGGTPSFVKPMGSSYFVEDRCERLELLAAWQSGGSVAVLPYMGSSASTRKPLEEALAGCTWARYWAVAEGSDFDGRMGRYFTDQSRAEAWLGELKGETVRNRSVPYDATVMGFRSSDHAQPERFGGIWFAPWDNPLDEVRVVAESVAVRHGVLRGLVRNWSRHKWAYEVTVSAGELVFEWPLSIQPGELAPFELHDWDGTADLDSVAFNVEAEMSPNVDPSRAFSTFGAWDRLLVGEYAQRPLAAVVRDSYPQVTADVPFGAVSTGILESGDMLLRVPNSHPSLADDIESLTIEDLRGYGALVGRDGRIVDVAAAAVGRFLYDEGDEGSKASPRPRWESVPSLPHRDLDLIGVSLRLDVHGSWPDLEAANWQQPLSEYPHMLRLFPEDRDWWWEHIEGAYIFWIGAAYPWLEAEAR